MPGVVDSYVRGTEDISPGHTGEAVRRAFLLEGVTTTCNTGHSLNSLESFDTGPIIGGVATGRVYNSGPQVSTKIAPPPQQNVAERLYQVTSEQEIIDAITQLKSGGADFISISIGVTLDPLSGQLFEPIFSNDQARQIVTHASLSGMRVRASVLDELYMPRTFISQAPIMNFVPAFRSIDSLISPINRNPYIFAYTYEYEPYEEILSGARDRIIDMANRGILLVPMITVMDEKYPWVRPATSNPSPNGTPERSIYEEVVAFFVDIGGRVALGSGFQPGDDPGMPMDEILALKRSGMTNLEIIPAITYHAAIACGAEDEIGTLSVGKRGDVIVLDGDVLNDITALERPTHVFLDGKLLVLQ
jgi:hypothetical protein